MVRYPAAASSTHAEAQDVLREAAAISDAVTEYHERDTPEAVKPFDGPLVSRQQFRDFLIADRNRARNCGTLPLTVLLWITFLFVTWNHGSITSVHQLRRCLHRTVTDARVPQPLPGGAFGPPLVLENVSSAEEVWTWISHGLVPALSGPQARPGYVCTFSQVLGKIQLRQSRQAVGACQVEGPLADYFRGECRSDFDSRSSYGAGQLSSGDPAFTVGGGMLGLSEENKRHFFGWLDPRQTQPSQQRAAELAAQGWCDDSTSQLEAQVALFNAEVQAFVLITVTFTFERGGLVTNHVRVSPLLTHIYPTTWFIVVDITWLLLIIAFFFMALQEAFDRKDHGCVGRCCGSIWMLLDWVSIVCGLAVVGFFVFFAQHTDDLAKKAGDLVGASSPSAGEMLASNTTAALRYDGKLTNIMEDLDWLTYFKANHRLGMFWYCMMLLCRLFRGLTGQPRIHLMSLTFEKASSDVAHFGAILLATFENFVLGGYVLFGVELAEWASVSQAHRSTLMVLFGQRDFTAMYDFAPIRATLWLVLFLISVVFLVSNMVVAILANHYREAKLMTSQASPSLYEQAVTVFGDTLWKMSYHYRTVHRFVYSRLTESMRRVVPRVGDEPRRVPVVPYDELLEAVSEGMEEAVEKEMETTDAVPIDSNQPFPWNPVSKELLLQCGCDPSTAEHLLWKCAMCIGGRLPDVFPADKLFFDFQNTMHGSYQQLDAMGEELQAWLSDRVVDLGNIEPRQRKLEDLSVNIQPSQLAWEGIPEALPALGDEEGGQPLQEEDLLQVGDRLLELGAEPAAESSPHALVPVSFKPP